MPHFTTVALDRLLEPGSRNPNPKTMPGPMRAGSQLSRSGKKTIPPRPPPILYATPDVTPLPDVSPHPDSPSSFPPSPYIVNHKRRGPRLLKTLGHCRSDSVPADFDQKIELEPNISRSDSLPSSFDPMVEHEPDVVKVEVVENGKVVKNDVESEVAVEEENGKSVDVEIEIDEGVEDFCDFLDTRSTSSNTEVDDIAGERLWKPSTPIGEYYDAFEEISSDNGTRLSSCHNVEDELREMRLNLLTEIERRKQAEESLENFQNQWQSLSHQLSLVGLTLPALPTDPTEQPSVDPAEELYQQVIISRFVANSVGRAYSRAEVEMEMEPLIQSKNFEIARLSDRLQYYEAANQEMSQRNQEAIEMARQHRHMRKRRQRWLWGSLGLALTLGSAAIAWSYIPASKPSSSSHESEAAGN